MTLDFVSFRCAGYGYLENILFWSFIPIALVGASTAVRFLRLAGTKSGDKKESRRIKRQHMLLFFLVTYLFLPECSRLQFQALDCVTIAGRMFIQADTSVACASRGIFFNTINGFCICVYLTTPLLWFHLLHRKKGRLNPRGKRIEDKIELRDADAKVKHLK